MTTFSFIRGNLTLLSLPAAGLYLGLHGAVRGVEAEEQRPHCVLPCSLRGAGLGSTGRVKIVQRQIRFIDKATALNQAETETPPDHGHTGVGCESH